MQHGMLAVSVYNITRNKPLYDYNSQLGMAPGSVNKLLTTGVAFARLGSDFRFTTKLGIRGVVDRDGVLHGDIYIIGGGDPMLGSYRYRQTSIDSLFEGWMLALKKKGIHRVDGRVCYNQSIYDEEALHDSWPWGDVGNAYGAGVYGLNFHENMYFAHFDPGAKLGYRATAVRTVPKNIDVKEVCEVTTGPANSGDQVIAYGSPTANERIYRGTVPLGKKDFSVRISLPNPAKQCADLFASAPTALASRRTPCRYTHNPTVCARCSITTAATTTPSRSIPMSPATTSTLKPFLNTWVMPNMGREPSPMAVRR